MDIERGKALWVDIPEMEWSVRPANIKQFHLSVSTVWEYPSVRGPHRLKWKGTNLAVANWVFWSEGLYLTPCAQEACALYDRHTASSSSIRRSYILTVPSPKLARKTIEEPASETMDVTGLSALVSMSYTRISIQPKHSYHECTDHDWHFGVCVPDSYNSRITTGQHNPTVLLPVEYHTGSTLQRNCFAESAERANHLYGTTAKVGVVIAVQAGNSIGYTNGCSEMYPSESGFKRTSSCEDNAADIFVDEVKRGDAAPFRVAIEELGKFLPMHPIIDTSNTKSSDSGCTKSSTART